MNYLFHLGRDPELSILEIVSFLQRTAANYKILKITRKFVILDSSNLDVNYAIKCLGGTIKISSQLENLEDHIHNSIKSNRIDFGINVFESSQKSINDLVEIIKSVAKKERIKALHKHAQENEIPPSKSKNLDLELTLCKNLVYKVIAASDPKSYRDRDEIRPYFDPLQVVSVRLAKILINLAQPKKDSTLLDPFTGLGTIIQEASLMGINAVGTDNNPEMIKRSHANLSWARNKFNFKTNPAIKLLDVSRLSKELKNISSIATEPYLGPYLKKIPWESEAREIAEQVSRIYQNFIIQSSKLLKQGDKIAVVVPTFKTRNNKIIRIGFQSMLEKYNFKIYQPLNNTLVPVNYKLKNSKILRKIYVLEKM